MRVRVFLLRWPMQAGRFSCATGALQASLPLMRSVRGPFQLLSAGGFVSSGTLPQEEIDMPPLRKKSVRKRTTSRVPGPTGVRAASRQAPKRRPPQTASPFVLRPGGLQPAPRQEPRREQKKAEEAQGRARANVAEAAQLERDNVRRPGGPSVPEMQRTMAHLERQHLERQSQRQRGYDAGTLVPEKLTPLIDPQTGRPAFDQDGNPFFVDSRGTIVRSSRR
jgi:hypothetical protein